MLLSQETSPHVLTVMEADMGRVAAHREANKAAFERDGVKLTFTAYFIAAIVSALKAHPLVNSSWTDEGVLVHGAINVGMATSLGDEGLIVPVIKNADNLSLLAMARSVNDLAIQGACPQAAAGRGPRRHVHADQSRHRRFAVCHANHQPAAVRHSRHRCHPETSGGRRPMRPVKTLSLSVPMVYLSLVFDHRILDGASADAFLMTVKQSLETWS